MGTIDQLRGYAIFGMVLVNVLGIFDVMPWTLKHHNTGYSYADSIAPLFVFLVGMGFRMTLPRHVARLGRRGAWLQACRRYAILGLFGLIGGGFDLRMDAWDALLDIACSGILALCFIERSAAVRLSAAAAYLAAYQFCYSILGYGGWVMANSIDGGPLGPLSWVFLLLTGTLAWDILESRSGRSILTQSVCWSLLFAALGWTLRAEWGAWKTEWPFSQRGMSAPYPLYSAGLCFAALATAYIVCDVLRWNVPTFSVLGKNPLAMYILQGILCLGVSRWVPHTLPWPGALATVAAVYAICVAAAWAMIRHNIILKL